MSPSPQPYDDMCSLARLRALHDRALTIGDGGSAGIIDKGCEEGTLGAAWMAAGYDEIGQSQPHLVFGSYLLYYFATKQCFADANKRTAWLALGEVLATIGLEVKATDEEAIKFVKDVANKVVPDVHSVVKWVAERLQELRKPEAVATASPGPAKAIPAPASQAPTAAPAVSKSVTN